MTHTPLWLVRLAVDPVALRLLAEREGVADDDLGYAMHLALRRRYGAAAPQPFRWPAPMADGERWLLGYATDAEALAAVDGAVAAATALPDWCAAWDAPDAAAAVFPAQAETKRMPDAWHAGQRLGFTLRARPVIRYGGAIRRVRAAGSARPGGTAGERDVFLARIDRRDRLGETVESDPVSRAEAYAGWLRDRLRPGAALDAVRLAQQRRCRVVRRRHATGGYARIEGPEAGFEGVLTIADTDAFTRLLAGGVGRHGAFGFGMLLLRPAGP